MFGRTSLISPSRPSIDPGPTISVAAGSAWRSFATASSSCARDFRRRQRSPIALHGEKHRVDEDRIVLEEIEEIRVVANAFSPVETPGELGDDIAVGQDDRGLARRRERERQPAALHQTDRLGGERADQRRGDMRLFAGVDAFDIGLDDPPAVHLERDRDAGMELRWCKFLISADDCEQRQTLARIRQRIRNLGRAPQFFLGISVV